MSSETRHRECSPSLERALLSFFASTTVSSAIVETLAEGSLGISEILARVQDIRRMELPQTAVESSLTILRDAGLAVSSEGAFGLTEVGAELAAKLKELYRPPG